MIEEGKFYFIKDEYFELFKGHNLMKNKEDGTKRPCYFCFKDNEDGDIIWFVPISTKYDKYEEIYNNKKSKRNKVYNFVFGEVVGKKAVFLIQNIFPMIERFVQEKYKTAGKDVTIAEVTKKRIIAYSKQVVHMADCGINIAFNDIKEMKKILIKDFIMSDNILGKRRIERIACKEYFKARYRIIPEFIQLSEDPPDCYVKINDEYVAVEVTSCYMDKNEKNDISYKNALKEQIKRDTPLAYIQKHVGKKFVPDDAIILTYSNKDDLIDDLKHVQEHINILTINKNNVWLNNTGILYCQVHKEEYNFDKFLNSIENYEDVYLELRNRYKGNQVLKFHLMINELIYKYEGLKYKVSETYVFWDNNSAKLESIKNAIKKKLDMYDTYMEKVKNKNLKYDKYVLILDYIRFPCQFNNYGEVYNYLKEEFGDFRYDEIAILFWNNIMFFNNDGYMIK